MEAEKDDKPEMVRVALDAWRSTAQLPGAHDALQIAAWLEGRLDSVSSEAVERMLAADPILLEAVLVGYGAPQNLATPSEIEAARALVQLPWWQRLVPEAAQPWRWGTAVAATVLVVSIGTGAFELGEAFAGISAAQQSAAMRSMLSNDLLDTLGEK